MVFLGGWWGPGATEIPFLGFLYLMIKTTIVYIPSLILRATIPRLRVDQMMSFNWKVLVPISILNVVVMALLIKIVQVAGIAPAPGETDFLAHLPMTVVLLLGNVGIGAGVVTVLRNAGRRDRMEAQDLVLEPNDEKSLSVTVAH